MSGTTRASTASSRPGGEARLVGKGRQPAAAIGGFEPAVSRVAGGIWRLGGVVDTWAKLALACPTSTIQDAIAAIQAAVEQAEQPLGWTLLEDCTDPVTGEANPVVIVTDNSPAYRSTASPPVGDARSTVDQPFTLQGG